MSDTIEMVTLTAANGETWQVSPETELTVHEAAKWSGYNPQSLRRVDSTAGDSFPHAHFHPGNLTRFWHAREIALIIDYKIKTAEAQKKRAGSIYLLAQKARKQAKAEARKAR